MLWLDVHCPGCGTSRAMVDGTEPTGCERVAASRFLRKLPMKKVEDYRQHAAECRQMANRSRSSEDKNMLFRMAETWEALAVDRAAHVARQRRLAALDAPPYTIPIGRLNASNDD
jgi:hypothetical protein